MDAYHFTPRQVGNARWKCLDCGVNVIKAGDFCMLQPALWERRLGLTWDDNMCVGCIETRLGRKLSMRRCDFICFPHVEGYPMSAVLRSRIVGNNVVPKGGEVVARDSPRGKAALRKR
jgi:hypothetical protein